jgi:RimJ/RimL family protein N-acetyltransferase
MTVTRIASLPVPTLETERLRMRGHTLADFDTMLRMWSDPQVTRFIGGRPQTEEECWARLLRYLGHWSLLGYGYWLVEEKSSGSFVGEAGFLNLRRDIQPPLGDGPEAGWVLSPAHHGKGYATEAMRAALQWGKSHFGSETVVCLIHPENRSSLHVAQKCGFKPIRQATYKDKPTIVLETGDLRREPGASAPGKQAENLGL